MDIEFSSDEDNDKHSSPAQKQKHIRRIVADYRSVYHVDKMHSDRSTIAASVAAKINSSRHQNQSQYSSNIQHNQDNYQYSGNNVSGNYSTTPVSRRNEIDLP